MGVGVVKTKIDPRAQYCFDFQSAPLEPRAEPGDDGRLHPGALHQGEAVDPAVVALDPAAAHGQLPRPAGVQPRRDLAVAAQPKAAASTAAAARDVVPEHPVVATLGATDFVPVGPSPSAQEGGVGGQDHRPRGPVEKSGHQDPSDTFGVQRSITLGRGRPGRRHHQTPAAVEDGEPTQRLIRARRGLGEWYGNRSERKEQRGAHAGAGSGSAN